MNEQLEKKAKRTLIIVLILFLIVELIVVFIQKRTIEIQKKNIEKSDEIIAAQLDDIILLDKRINNLKQELEKRGYDLSEEDTDTLNSVSY